MNTISNQQSSRLLSLDILRGITIAGMILVNNPGSWSHIYAPLQHAPWEGLTPTDLVFPFFMFIMGISTYLSLMKQNFAASPLILFKIAKRTVLIFIIGLALSWFGLTCRSLAAGDSLFVAMTHFENLRILGVLQRLGLSYGIAALLSVCVKHKYLPLLISVILVGYFLILLFGNGFEQSENNLISVIDRAVLGANHMYKEVDANGVKIAFDPEGLLSTLPCVAHVLIGFLCGKWMMEKRDNFVRIQRLLLVGTGLAFAGYFLHYGCPINKKIWSPTYVLITCGMAAQLLAVLIWLIDVKRKDGWTTFFHTFGINPLIIFVFAGVIANILVSVKVPFDGKLKTVKGYVYDQLLQPYLGDKFGSLLFSLLIITVCWSFGYYLYKKKIYIKI